MGANAILRPTSLAVQPGGEATCEVVVRNTGTVVDEFIVEVLGDTAAWAKAEPATLSLFPGAEATARVTFSPPRSSSVPSGSVPFAVRVSSKEDPTGSVAEEGTLDVGPFSEIFAELVPRASRGARRGKHEIAIDNRGNTPANVTLTASDAEEALNFEIRPPGLVVDAGTVSFAKLIVKPKKKFLRGPPQTHAFQVVLSREGEEPVPVDGTILQEGLIPKWLVPALLAVAAAVIAWIVLVKPAVEDAAKKAVEKPITDLTDKVKSLEPKPPGGGGGTPTSGPTPIAGLTTSSSFDRRLVASAIKGAVKVTTYTVPAKTTVSISDLILENPQGDLGLLQISRDGGVLLEIRLDNFRDLDYHFVSALIFGAGKKLNLTVRCDQPGPGATACSAGVYATGFAVKSI